MPAAAKRLVGLIARGDLMRLVAKAFVKKPIESAVDDEGIRRAVVDEISRQGWSGKGLMHAAVHDGVVELTGTVYDDRTLLAARVAAENVRGVKSVSERPEWIEPTSGMMILPYARTFRLRWARSIELSAAVLGGYGAARERHEGPSGGAPATCRDSRRFSPVSAVMP